MKKVLLVMTALGVLAISLAGCPQANTPVSSSTGASSNTATSSVQQ